MTNKEKEDLIQLLYDMEDYTVGAPGELLDRFARIVAALEAEEAPKVLAVGYGWEDDISGVGPCWIVSKEYEPADSFPVTITRRS